MPLTRLFAAVVGLALPVLIAGTADARPRHRHVSHHGARVVTATYKVAPHKMRAHRYHVSRSGSRSYAQAHRHSIMRGS